MTHEPSRARAVVLPFGNEVEAQNPLSATPNGVIESGDDANVQVGLFALAPVLRPTTELASVDRAVTAVESVFKRLEQQVAAGNRSWSIVEAAKAEWDALLDDTDGLRAAQQFLVWYLAENRGGAEDVTKLDWQMAMQKLKRWRSLALYGVDQAVTRGIEGVEFWKYVEAVCKQARAEMNGGGS